jgi:hypothetical protein
MSIPTLCQACYKHYRSTVVTACPFCVDVQFPEQVLCDLVQEGQSEKQSFRCAAFRPALSVVRHDEIEALPTEEGSEEMVSMSPKDKWFRAYAVQQLSSRRAAGCRCMLVGNRLSLPRAQHGRVSARPAEALLPVSQPQA